MMELVTVLAIFAGGVALLRGLGLAGWALPPLGFLAGVFLLLDVGFLQVVTGIPTWPAVTVAVVAVLPLGWWVVRWWRGHDVRVRLPLALACLVGLAAAVLGLRAANLFKWHDDSLTYLMAGRLLAENQYRSTASTSLVTERVLGVPLLHAPAELGGEFYLRTVTPLLCVAMLAMLVWVLRCGMVAGGPSGGAATRWSGPLAGLALLALMTDDRSLYNAFYLNGHLLMGVLLLVVAASGWLLAVRPEAAPRAALMALQVLAVPALIITRPEGAMMCVLAVLPTVLSLRIDRRHRSVVLGTLGLSTMLFAGFQTWLFHDRGTAVPVSVVGPVLLGAALLCLVPLLRWGWLGRHAARLLLAVEAAIWLGLLAGAVVRGPHVLKASVKATYINQVRGPGAWGLFLVLVCALLLVAMVLLRLPYQEHLRFPLTTFVPLVFLLAYLREGAYRVGAADSLNRMIFHVVPLAMVFLVLLLAVGRRPGSHPDGDTRASDFATVTGVPTQRPAVLDSDTVHAVASTE